jgi:hypothetical protein
MAPARWLLVERLWYVRRKGWPVAEAHLAQVIRVNWRAISETAGLSVVSTQDPQRRVVDQRTQEVRYEPASKTRKWHSGLGRWSLTAEGFEALVTPPGKIVADDVVKAQAALDGIVDRLAGFDVTVRVEKVTGSVARMTVVLRDTLDQSIDVGYGDGPTVRPDDWFDQ